MAESINSFTAKCTRQELSYVFAKCIASDRSIETNQVIGTAHRRDMIGMLLNINWQSSCAKPNLFDPKAYKHTAMNDNPNNSKRLGHWAGAQQTQISPVVCQCSVFLQFGIYTVFVSIRAKNVCLRCSPRNSLLLLKLNFVVWTLSDTMNSQTKEKDRADRFNY